MTIMEMFFKVVVSQKLITTLRATKKVNLLQLNLLNIQRLSLSNFPFFDSCTLQWDGFSQAATCTMLELLCQKTHVLLLLIGIFRLSPYPLAVYEWTPFSTSQCRMGFHSFLCLTVWQVKMIFYYYSNFHYLDLQ